MTTWNENHQHLLGVDTGGTFTDFVYLTEGEFKVHKVLSTPADPEEAIRQGILDLGLASRAASGQLILIHGTTVATNATLQGKGVRTAYITNKGLADVLLIGRQTRPDIYALRVTKPEPPIDSSLLFEIDVRLDAAGNEVTPMDNTMLQALHDEVSRQNPEAVAINLLFSFINDDHEKRIAALFEESCFVSRSSFVLPEYREYERGIATWVNAWIGPLIERYMLSVKDLLSPSPVSVMQSNGTTIAADQASKRAVNLLLSGPAGGLSAAMIFQPDNLITFDMGGTSTDVALLTDGIRLTNENAVAGFPIAVPMADIHTIGAGGGSIATVDAGGLLQVGPQSAGANPGPACYGLGGVLPTVTDANLILGRLRPDAFLGGRMSLTTSTSVEAVRPLANTLSLSIDETALGIIDVANEHMIQALRHISVQRGFDPGEFSLVCFGGAGGLHLCALAEAMHIQHAIIPVMSGVLSALGMLATNPGRELTRTCRILLADLETSTLDTWFADLAQQGQRELKAEGVANAECRYSLDLRYDGQTFTINIPYSNIVDCTEQFHISHEHQYGHRLDKAVELLNVRVHLEARRDPLRIPGPGLRKPGNPMQRVNLPAVGTDVPIYQRRTLAPEQEIKGPCLIFDIHATSLVKTGWELKVDAVGNLRLDRESD